MCPRGAVWWFCVLWVAQVIVTVTVCAATVIVRTALTPFGCTNNSDGVSTLVVDPTIRCSTSDHTYAVLSRLGGLAIAVYGCGLPIAFAYFLWKHRAAIGADQQLRAKGEGETTMTNPNISVRRRFRKLYEDFKPQYKFWKLILIARKLCLAMIGILVTDPVLQVHNRPRQ